MALPVTQVLAQIPYTTPQQQAITSRTVQLIQEVGRVNVASAIEPSLGPVDLELATEDAGPGDTVDIRV